MDVLTPPVVENPGMETHIHPFEVSSVLKQKNSTKKYLHTSPEFHMKELLSMSEEEFQNIFTLSYCFRDEPESEFHRSQFLMLEWYRKNSHYTQIMDDVENLIRFCVQYFIDKGLKESKFKNFQAKRVTVQELFLEYCKFDILEFLEPRELERKLRSDFKSVPVPKSELIYEDSFFLLFLNLIEPHFKNFPYLQVSEYPAPLAALSTLKETDQRVCERFEVYLAGVELCNCFNELTDLNEQKRRFEFQNKQKKELYGYDLNEPDVLYCALEKGLPKSSGVALGVERLLKSLFDIKNPFFQ